MNGFMKTEISPKDVSNHPFHGKIFYLKDTYDETNYGLRKKSYMCLKANKELISSAERSDATPFYF
jgi:hypothetical protein